MPVTKEIWKDISGYEGLYQVSSEGRVKSCERIVPHLRLGQQTIPFKILKANHVGAGYLSVTLCKNNSTKQILIHRLVADAFIPNPDNKPCINHKDCNRGNNVVSNIEWVTYQENIQYGLQFGLFFKNGGHKNATLSVEQVLAIRSENLTRKELREKYGVSKTIIARIINRKTWTHV